MSSIIKSVSLDETEDDFLKEYELSPTALLKEKIWEMKGMIKKVAQERIKRLVNTLQDFANQNEKLKKELAELKDVLEKKGKGTKEQ